MYQLPVNNLTRIRRARKQVKKALGDIGLEFCKEAAEEFKDFCPDDQFVKGSLCLDICTWDPSHTKTQEYRSKPFCCTECSFSSKYYSGYKNHFRNVHRKIFDSKILLNCPYCTFTASKRVLETHVKIFHIPSSTRQSYGNPQGTALSKKDKMHLAKQGDGMEKAMYFCKKCSFRDTLYNVVRRHIYREHFQHIVSPYLGMVSDSSVKNGANSVNGNNILCKRCQFSTRSYEALVQHVVEYHERIGAQVTTMIGHANVIVARPQSAMPVSSQQTPLIIRGHTLRPEPLAQPVIGYLKPVAPVAKPQPSTAASQVRVKVPGNNTVAENNAAGINTAQTQKWKICTVCNELFPENLYNAHFENAHKAKKVWALAKYIMKIHNFTSKCLLCNRYLPSDTLLNHMLIHGLTCPQCHSAFHNVEKMIEHVALSHPDDFVGPPGASPLTFDLTIKQEKSTNVQLVVLTFNMKESINGQDQGAPSLNSLPPMVKLNTPRATDKKGESLIRGFVAPNPKSEVGKTLCPLCFTILRGPISDALAMHLRERHQVLQTMHPVEKKMTYKCIHCLGVYTSNMVASTITLHLVQCRAVGRNQANQAFKSALTLNSSGAGFLKRQPPMQAMSNPKRMKLNKESKISSTTVGNQFKSDDLALDPRSYEHKTYEARKDFLTAYFNRRPYLSLQEEEKLSASLWLWKSDIASHFSNKRKMCERQCETKKVSVLLGFDMHAVKKVKHNLTFEDSQTSGIPVGRSGGLKTGTPSTDQNKPCETLNCTLKLSTCTETISIDSDSEPEIVEESRVEEIPTENGNVDTNQHEDVKSEKHEDAKSEKHDAKSEKHEDAKSEEHKDVKSVSEQHEDVKSVSEQHEDVKSESEQHEDVKSESEQHEDVKSESEQHEDVKSESEQHEDVKSESEQHEDVKSESEQHEDVKSVSEQHEDVKSVSEQHEDVKFESEQHEDVKSVSEQHEDVKSVSEQHEDVKFESEQHEDVKFESEQHEDVKFESEQHEDVKSRENEDVTFEIEQHEDMKSDVKSEELVNLTGDMEPIDIDDLSPEKESSLQDGEANAWITLS